MKYSACIFDLDGTLLDTLEDLTSSVNFALKQGGYPERTIREVRLFIGNGIYKLVKRALPDGTDEDIVLKTFEIFKNHYQSFLNVKTCEYEGITQLLAELKSSGIKTAVVTNKAHPAAKALTDSFFDGLIDYTVGQKQGVPTKPDPTSLNEALTALGVSSREAVFVGDSDVDVKTAHNGEMPCIGVTWGFRSRDVLTNAGADFIVDSPREIIDLFCD